MKLIQVHNQYGDQYLFQSPDKMTDEQIELVIMESTKICDDNETRQYLENFGITEIVVDVDIQL